MSYQISLINDERISDSKKGFLDKVDKKATLSSLETLAKASLKFHLSLSVFDDNKRLKSHFKETSFIAFDFDTGFSPERFRKIMKCYSHVSVASKNHLRDKGDGKGVIPRFHAFIELSRPIRDPDFYKWLVKHLKARLWLPADKACVDCTRYFYKHSSILYINEADPIDITLYENMYELYLETQRLEFQKLQARVEKQLKNSEVTLEQREKACRVFLQSNLGGSISGQGGDVKTYKACIACIRFRVEINSMMRWYNTTLCSPQWSESQLKHKIKSSLGCDSPPYSDKFIKSLIGEQK